MSVHKQTRKKAQKDDIEKRQKLGQIVKSLRVAAQMSQLEFAEAVGQRYLSFISQVECGRIRIPPADTALWADVLGVDAHAFAKECVRYYESPAYFNAIYRYEDRKGDLL